MAVLQNRDTDVDAHAIAHTGAKEEKAQGLYEDLKPWLSATVRTSSIAHNQFRRNNSTSQTGAKGHRGLQTEAIMRHDPRLLVKVDSEL